MIAEVVARIKERLRTVPKLDVLSMPFRVSFVKVGAYRYSNSLIAFHCLSSQSKNIMTSLLSLQLVWRWR